MSKRTIVKRPSRKMEKPTEENNAQQRNGEERSWQQMFIVSEHWRSDLEFLNDELSFMRKLIDRYLMWLIDEKNITDTRKQLAELSGFEKRHKAISEDLAKHLGRLTNLIENPFSHNAQDCKDAHVTIEAMVAALVKDFRVIKKAVFVLTEKIMESEKAKHLIRD